VNVQQQAPFDLKSLSDHLVLPYVRGADFAIPKEWSRGSRQFLDYLLIYFEHGSCIITVDGVEHEFSNGDFCLIQPGSIHSLHNVSNIIAPFARLDFFYNAERKHSYPLRSGPFDLTRYRHLLQPRLNDFDGVHVPVKFVPSNPIPFRETFLRLIGLWQSQEQVDQLEVQHLATEIILFLLRDYHQSKSDPTMQSQSLDWVTAYLSRHLAESITVEDMARWANLSVSRFSHAFRQRLGLPPYQYLLHLRVHHAQELLEGSTFSVQQISEYCGFADVQHFSKSFKRVVGISPSVYRTLKSKVRILVTVPMADFDKILTGLNESSAELYATIV